MRTPTTTSLLPTATLLAALSAGLGGVAHADDGDDKDKGGGVIPAPEVTGLVQLWVTAWDQDVDPLTDPASYGDPEDDVGFKVRRARIGIEGRKDGLRYDVEFGHSAPFDAVVAENVEENDGLVEDIVDASGGYRPVKGLWIDGGVMKVPVAREFLMSSARLPFVDRSLVSNWMPPGRDVGVLVDGSLGDRDKLQGRLRVGAFNGNGLLSGDENPGKLYSVRLEGKLGPGAVYKTHGQVDSFTLGVGGDFWNDADLATTTTGTGGDLMMRVAGFSLLAQGHMATLKPTNSSQDLPQVLAKTPRLGAVAIASYSIGDFEPALRFATFDDNQNIDDNGDVAEIMGGVTWHGDKDAVRAGGGYVSRLELGGRSFDNDSVRLWMQLHL